MVELDFGFICANIKYQENGMYSAEDIGLRGVVSSSVPVRRPGLVVVIRMKTTAADVGPKRLGFTIIDLDGNDVIEFGDQEWTPEPPPPGEFYRYDGVDFNLNDVSFPEFGEYTMIFRVDGVDLHRMIFNVRESNDTTR